MKKKVDLNLSDNRFFAFIIVFLSIIGFVLFILSKKKDNYEKFYAKQSLVIFIYAIIVWGLGFILKMIPFIGEIIYAVLVISVIAIWIFTLVFSLSGKQNYAPLIGSFADKINF